jgi:hypothetical protein
MISAVRFTDSDPLRLNPSSKLLGYYHSSACADWHTEYQESLSCAADNSSISLTAKRICSRTPATHPDHRMETPEACF